MVLATGRFHSPSLPAGELMGDRCMLPDKFRLPSGWMKSVNANFKGWPPSLAHARTAFPYFPPV